MYRASSCFFFAENQLKMNFQLLSALHRSAWFIHPDIAEGYYHIAAALLEGRPVNLSWEPLRISFYAPGKTKPFYAVDYEQPGDYSEPNTEDTVMVMPVEGILMKNDQMCGPVGMQTMGNILKMADQSPNIKGVVLKIDSPGGQADGIQELASVIKGMSKPVYAHVDGMAASAGFWLASAADQIIANNRSQVGSIGAMVSFADMQPALEQQGVRFHKIVSSQNPDKNALFEKVRSGDYSEYREKFLNPLAQDFIDAVKANRPAMQDAQTTGKTYFAQDVTGTMVDRIATLEETIEQIAQQPLPQKQAKPGRAPAQQISHKSNTKMTQFEQILAELEVERDADGNINLNDELLININARLTQAPAAATPAPPEPAPAAQPDPTPPATEPTPAAQTTMTPEMQEQMNALRAELEELRNQAGATTARVKPQTDPGKTGPQLVTKPDAPFWDNVMAVKETYLS